MMVETSVRDVLRAYAAKKASMDTVMRTLARHRGWLVPVPWLGQRGIDRVEALVMFSTDYAHPAGALLAFTDREAAERAQAKGMQLGPYAERWDGVDLLASLEQPGMRELRVNAGGPSEEAWFMEKGSFALGRLWSDATGAERALEDLVAGKMAFVADPARERARLDRIRRYDAWVVPMQKGTNNILGMPTPDGGRNGLLFSAPDALEAWLARVSPDVRAMVASGSAGGEKLFAEYRRQGFDFLFVNPLGPSPRVVMQLDPLIAALAATR